jgi:hypothetical protein
VWRVVRRDFSSPCNFPYAIFRLALGSTLGRTNVVAPKTLIRRSLKLFEFPAINIASTGNPCDQQTIGLLYRRHIKIDLVKCIGKESNSQENVEEGLEHSEKNVYTVYDDPRRTEWIVKIQPALKRAKLKVLVRACGERFSRPGLIKLRAGRIRNPHRKTQELLVGVLKKLKLI